MKIEDKILQRISDLIEESSSIKRGNHHGQVTDPSQMQMCKGWIAAATNILSLAIPDSKSPYRKSAFKILDQDHGYMIHEAVGDLSEILRQLLSDLKSGLVSSIIFNAKAETFDEFLDHAKAYLKENKKKESGVIAGVVFEDCIRSACRKKEIEEKGIKIDQLITDLTNATVFTATKAKRARVAAGVRTKATHAQWEEFDIEDVKATINFTEEIISNVLES